MFLKNGMRPVTVGAGDVDPKQTMKTSSMMFSNGSAESADFGAFGDEPERTYHSSGSRGGSNKNKGGFSFDRKKVIIAAIAAAVILVLAVVVGVFMLSKINLSGNVKYADNAYMVYADGTDKYYIVANGEVLEETFDSEPTIIPAADNSFAYVMHEGDDGLHIYILEGKELTSPIGNAVEEYKVVSDLEPGIVFTETSGQKLHYMLYNEKIGIDTIATEDDDPKDFAISADGRTVVYTEAGDDANDRVPYVFEEIREELSEYTTSKVNGLRPVAVSYHGDYVYCLQEVSEGRTKLFVVDVKKGHTYPVNNSEFSTTEGFLKILEMNVKGDEVIFCTGVGSADNLESATEVISYLYRHKASEEKSTTTLGPNFVYSAKVDPEVSAYKNFAGKYLETVSYDDTADQFTYRLSGKYELETICKYRGKFDPDGEYLYAINKDSDLVRWNLKNTNESAKTIYRAVENFHITEKGNIYLISGDYLVFYKVSTGKKPRISYAVTDMSFYSGSNKLYLSEEDAPSIFFSEEGSTKEKAKLGSSEITALPYFSSQTGDKSYAVIYDENKGGYTVYYTSNGNRFTAVKNITTCTEICYGVDIPEEY